MARAELGDVPVVVGSVIPPEDAAEMKKAGAAAIFTPKDYDLTAILAEIVEIVEIVERAKREAA